MTVRSHPSARAALVGIALAVLASACGAAEGAPAGGSGEITVAAASDLRPAFAELGRSFEAETGTTVTFSFGSSGQLAEQVLNGAPFDVFASANVDFVDDVVEAGRADGATKATYGFGRIVVYSPSEGPDAVTTLAGLADPGIRHVAIANPDHAPYGAAADQALRAAGVHAAVGPKLVLGENVSDTLRLAASGNADAAVVALSLVITADAGSWAPVDGSLHEPLEQALVVTRADPATAEAARAFAAYVGSPAGRAVMNSYGFVLPGEGPA